MRTLLMLMVLVALTAGLVLAQPAPAKSGEIPPAEVSMEGAYQVPFASAGNMIELAVENRAAIAAEQVQVAVAEAPAWLVVEPEQLHLEGLAAGAEMLASFTFTVAKSAPVGEVHTLRFAITAAGRLIGEKTLQLQVEAPTEIALDGNYPNPFNPRTTIGYTLPQTARVDLRVYDMLGREVARLVSTEQAAGYHEAAWEATRFASGVYIYRLVAEAQAGERAVRQRTMLLVK